MTNAFPNPLDIIQALEKMFSPLRSTPSPTLIQEEKKNLPSNLLNDLTDESSTLAQVALGPRDTRLDDTGGGFLLIANACQRPSSAKVTSWMRQRSSDPPRGETVTTRTWPLFRPTARPVLAGASLAILLVVVDRSVMSKNFTQGGGEV